MCGERRGWRRIEAYRDGYKPGRRPARPRPASRRARPGAGGRPGRAGSAASGTRTACSGGRTGGVGLLRCYGPLELPHHVLSFFPC